MTQRTLAALALVTVLLLTAATPAQAATVDAVCTAAIEMNFDPPATQPIPPGPGPHSTSDGGGDLTLCQVTDGAATSGVLTYWAEGNLTCTSAQNVSGVLDITWSDGPASHGEVTGLLPEAGSAGGTAALSAVITSGRFQGDTAVVANLRDPLALLACLTVGLSHTTGTTILTFLETP